MSHRRLSATVAIIALLSFALTFKDGLGKAAVRDLNANVLVL